MTDPQPLPPSPSNPLTSDTVRFGLSFVVAGVFLVACDGMGWTHSLLNPGLQMIGTGLGMIGIRSFCGTPALFKRV